MLTISHGLTYIVVVAVVVDLLEKAMQEHGGSGDGERLRLQLHAALKNEAGRRKAAGKVQLAVVQRLDTARLLALQFHHVNHVLHLR